jgi:hypothetical protein
LSARVWSVLCPILAQAAGHRAPVFSNQRFSFFPQGSFFWLFYATARFVWNYLKPFNPDEFALSNAIKSEFSVTAILLLMWLFSFRPLIVKPGFSRVVAVLLLIGLYVNIAIRLYGIRQGIFAEDHDPIGDDVESALFIPFLNMNENPFTLRFFGPLAVPYGRPF